MSGEEVKMALEIINTLAIVIASIVAICGISAWRKEFQGKRNIELAEEVLILFYEAKDAIRMIRNPNPFHRGEKTRKPEENETPRQKEARDRFYFIYEGFGKKQDIFNKLTSKRFQFKARFGNDKDKPFEDLKDINIEIINSAQSLVMRYSQPFNKEDGEIKKEINKDLLVICGIGEDDPISPRVNKVVSDIESICKPIIMGNK